jgi:hypothetical protein
MDDTLAVQQPHGASNLLQEEPDGVFTQGAHGVQVVSQVPAVTVLHDQVD